MSTYNISKACPQISPSPSQSRRILPAMATLLLLTGCATVDQASTAATAKTAETAETAEVVDVKILALAERAIERKRYKYARGLIQRILLNNARNKNAQVLWAELLLATGAPRTGIKYFEVNIDDPTLGARALQGKGLALLWMGQAEKAKVNLELALKKDPTLWRALNGLGYYYDSLGSWKLSAEAYEKAIDLNRKSALLFNNRGYSRLLQRRIKEAIWDFTAALRLNSRLKIARVNLRLAVAWSGEYERALLGGEKKDLPRILNNVGFVALLRGDLIAAEGLLLRAVETDAAYNVTARKNIAYIKSLKQKKGNKE